MRALMTFLADFVIFALLAAGPVSAQMPEEGESKQPPAAPVAVSPVVQREVESGQTFVGTVVPVKTATIGSAVDGRVVEFPVNEGDRVEAGQPLAQLLTETIRLQLANAEAQLALRQAELAELENGSRPEEIAQARAKMLSAKASMEYEQARERRMRKLHERGSATQEELDQVIAAADQAEQNYLDMKAAHQLAVEGPRQEQIDQARAQVKMQQAVVDRLSDQIEKHTIISRFDGYVTAEHTEIGSWVNRGDPVAEVVALDEVDIRASVVEQHAPFVDLGESVRVEIPAISDEVFTGHVALVVPQADTRTRTFPVKVRVKNRLRSGSPLIKSGMLARVTLRVGETRPRTLVPKDALVLGGPQPMVYVVDLESEGADKGTVRPVTVQPGVADGTLIAVTGDLKPGQQVVVRGNERLQPGAPVTIQEVMTSGAAPAVSAAE